MSEADIPDFDSFLSEVTQRETDREAFNLTVNRFTIFLSERGVVFDPNEFLGLAHREEDPFSRVSIQSMAAQNRMQVITLAAMKHVTETIAEKGGILPADCKKRLQAKSILNGQTQAWFELVDAEFLGDSLTEDDLDILAEEEVELDQIYDETETICIDTEVSITEYLGSLGVTELDEAAWQIVYNLTYLLAINKTEGDTARASARENAQIYALRAGVDMGVWGKVIEHFFSDL